MPYSIPAGLPAHAAAQLPHHFLGELGASIVDAYGAAHRRVYDEFPASQAKDLLPQERRARIEAAFSDLGRKHRSAAVRDVLNRVGNCSHVEVQFGDVVVTESAVREPGEMVRGARFRETLAVSNQLELFERARSSSAVYYGIIIHGPDANDPSVPGFITLRFPAHDYTSWVDGALDIVQLCGITLRRASATISESIEDNAMPQLKTAQQQANTK